MLFSDALILVRLTGVCHASHHRDDFDPCANSKIPEYLRLRDIPARSRHRYLNGSPDSLLHLDAVF